MCRAGGLRALAAMLALSALAALPTPLAAADAPTVMLVFDNSGSMWGRIEGDRNNKLSLAREAIGRSLGRLRPDVSVGLTSFARRRADCGDIEVIQSPIAKDREKITAPLEKLNPKGKGPVVQAVRDAARGVGAARPASIVIVQDDLDNCQQDPCLAGSDLKRDYPGLRVHVIGIGMKREELAKTACLADLTGGKLFDAQNATQLSAFIDEAITLAAMDTAKPVPTPQPASRPATAAAAAPAAVPAGPVRRTPPSTGPQGLWLNAVLTPAGEAAGGPVQWRVTRGGSAEVVYEGTGPVQVVPLPAGAYAVEARLGIAQAKQTFDVPADATAPTAASLALNAGALKLVARAQKGGVPLDQVDFTIEEMRGAGAAAAAVPVWLGRDADSEIALPAGTYRITAQRELSRTQRTVTVAAGSAGEAEMLLGAGRLVLKAAPRDDAEPLTNAVFILSEDDPDARQGRREVARSAAPTPDFVLPAGSYQVVARVGGTEVRDRVAVGAGESVKRTLIFGTGKLALTAKADGGAGREAVAFRIMSLQPELREVARVTASPQSLDLPPGNYRVEARLGAQNVAASRDVELISGRAAQLAFDLPAARVTLKLAPPLAAGGGTAEAVWDLRDAGNRSVHRNTGAPPPLVLAPGRYTVQVDVKQRRIKRGIELKAGEQRTIDVAE